MGIPKFFRWISERYPLTSQLIQENKIPEFDNLYLDFNAIIHNCSHPNDGDPHFRLSEEQIFTSIFSYVDHLFTKIRPKKLFFMAVDGVAPRAKMNQQRSRRFRTAKDAAELRAKAERKGEVLPEEKAFDSNCITPGTPFMARLSEQLKYFVNKKITDDSNWREVEVVLSGHDVPGEGEHKIMEYIRLARAQKDYNPNLRHCLYGLDADLIMLGLISHDPHFCLLREEVKFGPARKTRGNSSLEAINFYLLHLSLFREYLDLEFESLKTNSSLRFPYSLERIIDDFVLLAVFVGNDFLPNLPDLHIHENGLEKLFEIYKKVLPTLDGYLNDAGKIDLFRLQCILDEMAEWEIGVFEKEHSDLNWYKGKQTKFSQPPATANGGSLVLTESQHEIFRTVRDWVRSKPTSKSPLSMPNTFPAKDRAFITTLAKDLNLSLAWDGYDEQGNNLVSLAPFVEDEDDEDEEEDDMEAQAAVFRVLRKYDKATVHNADSEGDFDTRAANALALKMDEWKRDYYGEKLAISYDDSGDMGKLVYRYIEGLQWVMYYYFTGVKSWGWFYDYHYAPRIGDLGSKATWGRSGGDGGTRGISHLSFEFELGQPFRPYEQLMGVLPMASRELVPKAYHDLMTNANSPIASFYPTDFALDLNGKKADWEAIVKIPFIDQVLLLSAMATREKLLTAEEVKRNGFGVSWRFEYTGINAEPTEYPSSLPGFFPPIHRCMCRMEVFDLPTLDPDLGLSLVAGESFPSAVVSASAVGFPSLHTLPHTHAVLGYHHVNVHGTESRNQSIVVQIKNTYESRKTEDIGREVLGKRTFIGWPFLQEGMVVALSDELFRYEKVLVGGGVGSEKVIGTPHNQNGLGYWKSKADRIENVYSKRFGVVTGPVEVLLHVRPLKGLKRLEDGSFIKDYEGIDKETEAAVQMTISSSAGVEDPRFVERAAPKLEDEFPEGSRIFFLGEHAYGVAAQVSGTTDDSLSVVLAFFPSDTTENAQFKSIVNSETLSSTSPSQSRWHPAFTAASILNISNRALSKITSSFMIITSDGVKHNLGLSIKFEAKGLKVVGYSRKGNGNDGIRGGGARQNWEYSDKAIELIREYLNAFPEIFMCLDAGGDGMLRASDVLSGTNPDLRVKEIKSWLKSKGVRDFEPVSLSCDHLSKDTVSEIEKLADSLTASKSSTSAIKKAIVKGIPRQAVLKPSHAMYRLQGQRFSLGDRVTMVMDSGAVPLAAKGVVVGLNEKNMDVVWDVPFMSGTTLGDRCSQYRGLAVEFNSCLNLSDPQFVTSTKPRTQVNPSAAPFKSRFGSQPHPHQPFAGVRPAPAHASGPSSATAPTTAVASNKSVHIMTNPNRGAGIGSRGGRGGGGFSASAGPANHSRGPSDGYAPNAAANGNGYPHTPSTATNGAPPRGRGRGAGFGAGFRGRGGGFPAATSFDRGRGRGFRGRGRGLAPQVQAQTSPSS